MNSAAHFPPSLTRAPIEVVSLSDPAQYRTEDTPRQCQRQLHSGSTLRCTARKGQPVTLRFLNAGACAYPKGWEGYRVVASYDRQHWFRIDTDFDGAVMTARILPDTQSVYFAYFEPYSYERHLDLIGTAAESEHVDVQHLGQTLDGRDMTLLRITDALSSTPAEQKKKIWLIARQHPGETMAEWFVEGFLERFQQRIHPLDVSRRVFRQAAFGQQGLVKQDVGQVVEVHAAVQLFHQRVLGVHFQHGLDFGRFWPAA
jgi:murein tripeptide amidase MpaA